MIKVAIPITGNSEFKALKKIVYNGKFVSGKNVELFEKRYANFVGTKYAVAVNSGTAALHAALASLKLKKGDEVIVPAISFVSSATSILHQGCTPIFCDVDMQNYCMCPESLEKSITKKTKAIIPVHFAGSTCQMQKIVSIAKKNKLKIIEDCSQAHGSKYRGTKVGNFGQISCFSFYATKHMTTGEGGILCTNNKKIYEIIDELISQGFSRVPVYEENLDKIKGVLYVKDLLPHIEDDNFNWMSLLRKPLYIPENKKLDDLLTEFKVKKIHMAIVVDEYGGTSGIITLEDVIEEIFGDISDEFDEEDNMFSKLDDNTYISSTFDEISTEIETLGGLLIEKTKKIPRVGEIIYHNDYKFIIEVVDKKRIKQVKLILPK